MRSKRAYKDKNYRGPRTDKKAPTIHDKNMLESEEYVEGAHDVVGEDARKSRDKAFRHNEKLI